LVSSLAIKVIAGCDSNNSISGKVTAVEGLCRTDVTLGQ